MTKQFHDVSSIFPLLEGEDFESFKQDIATNGLREAIWLHPDGSIIDGRNRYNACQILGIEPRYRTWNSQGSLTAFVVSLNLARRHLTASQRAIVGLEIKAALAKEIEIEANEKKRLAALEREEAKRKAKTNHQTDLFETSQNHQTLEIFPKSGRDATKETAQIVGVSDKYIKDAQKIHNEAPYLLPHIENKTLTIQDAKKLLKIPADQHDQIITLLSSGQVKTLKAAIRHIKDQIIAEQSQNQTVKDKDDCRIIIGDIKELNLADFEKYSVIIVDPPWKYDDDKGKDPRLGGFEYSSLTDKEIKEIPVKDLAADNCILFLWGTWPKVPEAVATMKAWGFKHVTGLPWIKITQEDKPRYGPGHWIAGCSEYVLIGRRGKVSPPSTDNYLGLMGQGFEHSRKPDNLHDIAEDIAGPYLEIFARRPRPGWTVFGNDIEGV